MGTPLPPVQGAGASRRLKVSSGLPHGPARARRTMRELVEAIAKALVDNPDQVRAIEGEQVTVFELRVHASDIGKVIGRQGRTANSIRTILNCGGHETAKARRARNP
jgi:uncharacterized protein